MNPTQSHIGDAASSNLDVGSGDTLCVVSSGNAHGVADISIPNVIPDGFCDPGIQSPSTFPSPSFEYLSRPTDFFKKW